MGPHSCAIGCRRSNLWKMAGGPTKMESQEFEWGEAKAESNLRKHGVDFADAVRVFDDAFADYRFDVDAGYGEQRMVVVGVAKSALLTVVYTERGERIRLISARKATKHEQREYHRSQTRQ